MSTPPLVCSMGLNMPGSGLVYCAEQVTTKHDHLAEHLRVSYNGRIVCICGDFNCASLDCDDTCTHAR